MAASVTEILDGFRAIAPSDTPHLLDLFETHGKRAWCYYSPFLNCYHSPPGRQVLVGSYDGATCLLSRTERKQEIYNLVVPPIPFDPTRTIAFMDFLRERVGVDPRVLWADEEDASQAKAYGFDAEEKEQEYFYDPSLIAGLEGQPYKELRKRVNRAERKYQPTCRPMGEDDIPAARALLKRWRKLQGRKHDFLLDWGYTRIALDRFGDWSVQDLGGWCVDVGGQMGAFGMAGRMSSDQACFFVAKSDPEMPGLAEILRLHIYRELSGFRRVNDAGDLGLPGLRQHKRRFRPVEMKPVYSLSRQ